MCENTCYTLSSSATNQGNTIVLVVKLVLPPATFATRQGVKTVKVPLCCLSS